MVGIDASRGDSDRKGCGHLEAVAATRAGIPVGGRLCDPESGTPAAEGEGRGNSFRLSPLVSSAAAVTKE